MRTTFTVSPREQEDSSGLKGSHPERKPAACEGSLGPQNQA